MDASAGDTVGERIVQHGADNAHRGTASRSRQPRRQESTAMPSAAPAPSAGTRPRLDGTRRSYSIDRSATAAVDEHNRRLRALAGNVQLGPDDRDLMPSRWWFAATAFPMVAGTLGPVASAFSICALVRPWRQEILPGETISTATFIKDPVWLTAINAIQLFMALVSNMFLLLNMTRRIRFSVAQPITMVGWYFSSLALIALTATAAGPLKSGVHPEKALVLSEAFYYAVYSAVLYMVVASLMVVTFVGAWYDHYPKDFQLTNSQRTLMLQTILVLIYLLLGALVFSNIEGWPYLDAVYWADVTLFTVGFGDFAAQTTLGRALLFPYALIGIVSLGLVIGSIRSLALERGRHRLDARMTEKNRRRVLALLAKKGKDDILQPVRPDRDGRRSSSSSNLNSLHGRGGQHGPRTNSLGLTEYERREEEFKIMRKIQRDASNKRRWFAMATSGGTWFALWLVGAYIFQACEQPYQGWDYFDGFYLAFVSLTTIGYGDMVPVSNAGRSFFVFWSLLALPTTTILISDAGDTIVKVISDTTNAIGRITILPGEGGVRKDFKEVLRALTCGAIFDFDSVDIEETPPGLLGAAQQTAGERENSREESEEEDEEEAEEVVEEVERTLHEKSSSEDDGTGDDPSFSGGHENGRSSNNNDGGGGGGGDDDGDDGDDDDGDNSGDKPEANVAKGVHGPQDTGSLTAAAEGSSAANGSGQTPSVSSTSGTGSDARAEAFTALRGGRRRTWNGGRLHSPVRSQSGGRASRKASGKASSSGSSSDASAFPTGYAFGSISSASVPRLNLPLDLPPTRAEYHCVLVDEIARVTAHLRHAPPRKYTFQEWAWFLKLIGEDESNADLHRRVRSKPPRKTTRAATFGGTGSGRMGERRPHRHHKGTGHAAAAPGGDADPSPDAQAPDQMQWSWVGARSPLMSSEEEAEWILDKLTRRLQAELRAVNERDQDRRHQEREEELAAWPSPSSPEQGHDKHDRHGNQDGGGRSGAADPGPYSRTSHLQRRETHPIQEEP